MTDSATTQTAQKEAKARRKAVRAVLRSKAKQCSSCGRCWPFVVFSDHHQCLRCSHPAREISRWTGIRNDMIQAAILARGRLQAKQQADVGNQLPQQRQKITVAHDLSILSEQQIEGVLMNQVGLRTITEPARAAIWIQLNFQPFPTGTVRQTIVYQSYLSFIANKRPHEPQPINGEEVIRLVERLWPGKVHVIGSPHYHLQGLEIRPSRMAYVLGTATNGGLTTNGTQSHSAGQSHGSAVSHGQGLGISPILPAATGTGSNLPVKHAHSFNRQMAISKPSNLTANTDALIEAGPSRTSSSIPAQVLPSASSIVLSSSIPVASAQSMSRRASDNPPPPLIEAALRGKRYHPANTHGHGNMVFGVSMQATSSNDSSMSAQQNTSGSGEGESDGGGGDWDTLRVEHKRPRMSKEHLDAIANGKMITKELSVQPRSRHSYSNHPSLASAGATALPILTQPITAHPGQAETTNKSTPLEVNDQIRQDIAMGNDDDEEEEQLEEMI